MHQPASLQGFGAGHAAVSLSMTGEQAPSNPPACAAPPACACAPSAGQWASTARWVLGCICAGQQTNRQPFCSNGECCRIPANQPRLPPTSSIMACSVAMSMPPSSSLSLRGSTEGRHVVHARAVWCTHAQKHAGVHASPAPAHPPTHLSSCVGCVASAARRCADCSTPCRLSPWLSSSIPPSSRPAAAAAAAAPGALRPGRPPTAVSGLVAFCRLAAAEGWPRASSARLPPALAAPAAAAAPGFCSGPGRLVAPRPATAAVAPPLGPASPASPSWLSVVVRRADLAAGRALVTPTSGEGAAPG